jgi:hypothetical protein
VAFEHRGDHGTITWLRELRKHAQELDSERKGQREHPRCLLELLANARRRRQQARYDDAVARLYRAVELFAQDRLYAAFGATCGRILLDALEGCLAIELRLAFPGRLKEGNRLELGCADAFAALQYSPFEADHRLPEVYERLKPALAKRNQSWLAHGVRPAAADDFDAMWDLVLRELGIAAESIPDWPRLRFTG